MILNVFPRKMVRVLLFSSCIKSYIFQAQLMFFFFFFGILSYFPIFLLGTSRTVSYSENT